MALGCRVNRAERDALAASLGPRFAVAGEGEPADFVVVNTCAITGDADSASRQAIRRAAREHPAARIVVAGCSAELAPGALAALPGVVTVVGARRQTAIPDLLLRLDAGEEPAAALGRALENAPAWSAPVAGLAGRARPTLKVQDGCDARCTYCVVPALRGPSRSMPIEEALSRLGALGERHAEVVLSGVHLGAYGRDLEPRRSLAEVVRGAAAGRLVRRLRLSSVEPLELPLELLREPESREVLCEHFHLPLQSGSPRVLAAMRRPCLAGEYAAVVERIAALVPGACIGADVMVGFPGETDGDHQETLRLVGSLPLAYLHVFPWSLRPGTAAAELPHRVPSGVARERAQELLALSDRRWGEYLAAQVRRDVEVVVERLEGGFARGTTRQYLAVRWPATNERRGALARVRVEASNGVECLGVGLLSDACV